MLDESHNESLQKKQVDDHVRLWDNGSNCVVSHYLTSEFIGHGKAEDLLPVLIKCVDDIGLNKSNLLQLSMDGPTVNWKLVRLLNSNFGDSDKHR
ncbi:hypothetical protein SNE40_005105 [Patella caerulea]|uniref:Uncharacterized protein n=1 Tax=Patella caerulea TaxID=87958 RepID=A0AAN8JZG6_PATCE